MKLKEIQIALAALGYTVGPLDGVWGPKTRAAVMRFQRDQGIESDGIIGPQTLGRLFPQADGVGHGMDSPILVWFQEARRLIGTREKPGRGSNPDILDWADDIDIPYDGDDIPWCGLFVGHCVGATLADEPLPAGLLRARAWEKFGIATKPTPGAVMVFWRGSPSSGLGHVGFYAGQRGNAYRILGGNQSDSVSLAWIHEDRFLTARWPATVAAPVPERVEVARNDPLSWNEG